MRVIDKRRQHRRAPGARERAVGGCRREGPVPRTSCSRRSTSSRAPSPTRCRSASPTAACSRPPSARRPPRSSSERRTCTSSPAARAIHAAVVGALLHRADLQAALLGRHRERVPLSQSARAAELAVRDDLAVRRDRRHARGAAPGEAVGLPVDRSPSATCRRARWCASPSS